ncbi:hypothetical protein MKW94_022044 [Papaver nudicaule]|uniref:SHSP domain-containing protein n=1 Tax=Papaver nudicaule TaxID=74823 RepID=A0AA41RSY0_PAPNU|nr:hypothetical protein [Papaver nudicaule]
MASLALRRAAQAPNLLKNLVRSSSVSVNPAHSFSRSFNSNASAEMIRDHRDEEEHGMDIDRRSSAPLPRRRSYSPNLLSDAFDPFSRRDYDLGSLVGMLDNVMKNPFVQPTVARGTSGLRRGWNVKEAEDALHLKIEMPGLGKENVKVAVEQNTLTIKGEGEKEDGDDDENVRKYNSRIELPQEHYKLDQVKAEMKNGILRVSVPKVKEEEKRNVHHVNVE